MISKHIISENKLIIFVKNPVPGKVKTRLARDIGMIKATKIYKDIVEKVVVNCTKSDKYTTSIYCYPPENTGDIKGWIKHEGIDYLPQTGTDLGNKMLNAFKESFSMGNYKTVIIGSDCIDTSILNIEDAFVKLDNCDVVIGPSYDGGYYLIGLKKPFDLIFNNIDWGTDTVLSESIYRLSKHNLSYHLLEYLNDIDTLDDLKEYDDLMRIYLNK